MDEQSRNVKEKMQVIGEIKLAVHSLYERAMNIKFIANNNDAGNAAKASAVRMESLEAMTAKLYVIKEKYVDLKSLTTKAQLLVNRKPKK